MLASVEELSKIDKHVYSLGLAGNLLSEELGDGLKKELACVYPHLERVNEEVITPEERKEFEKEWRERMEERERERGEKEREAEELRRAEEEEQRQKEEE